MGEKSYTGVNITATGAVLATGTAGKVIGFILHPNGSNVGTVVLRSGGAAGTIILQGRCLATESKPIMLPAPVPFTDGIYATLTGTGLNVIVLWRKTA